MCRCLYKAIGKMKVKVCGMKHNIAGVAGLNPDYMGFIFWEGSPRYFTGQLPPLSAAIKKVGVFVDAPLARILEITRKYQLQAIQLHGDETPRFCEELKAALGPLQTGGICIELLKVFRIKDHFDFSLLKPFETSCDYFLFDSKGKLPGGNGYGFDWHVLEGYPSQKPYFLSGGIGPSDLWQLREFMKRPEAHYCRVIDVNSRFESEAGRKEIEPLREFIETINENLEN